jgi:hypothetical protein
VKSLERWIIEGMCSSEGMLDPGRVRATKRRELKDAYGMVASIRRACQMEQ